MLEINAKTIDRAEKLEACQRAIKWLRAAPRTWKELVAHHKHWAIWMIDHGIVAALDYPSLVPCPGDGWSRHPNGGGWVEDTAIVALTAYVGPIARVGGNTLVFGDVRISGNAQVSENARLFGNAWVFDNARIFGNAIVGGNTRVFGKAQVFGTAWLVGNTQIGRNIKVSE